MASNDVVSGRADLIDDGEGESDQAEIKAQDDAALLVSDKCILYMHSTKQRNSKLLTLSDVLADHGL